MIRNLLASLLLVTLVCMPASAMETKCVVTGPAGSYLANIARVAAGAQNQAEEMGAYLRNSSVDWRTLADQTAYLADQVRTLRSLFSRFERMELALTPAQSEQFERLKAGLDTLTVFLNNTNQLIAERQLFPDRNALAANAKAMSVRSQVVREAARKLRMTESA
jgi:hypothetical protein